MLYSVCSCGQEIESLNRPAQILSLLAHVQVEHPESFFRVLHTMAEMFGKDGTPTNPIIVSPEGTGKAGVCN